MGLSAASLSLSLLFIPKINCFIFKSSAKPDDVRSFMASSFNNLFAFPSLSFQRSFKFGVKLNLILSFTFKTAQREAVAPGLSPSHLHTASFASPKSAPRLICTGWALQWANKSPPSCEGRWGCTWGDPLSNKTITTQSTPRISKLHPHTGG